MQNPFANLDTPELVPAPREKDHETWRGWVLFCLGLIAFPSPAKEWSWGIDTFDREDTFFSADPPYMLDTLHSGTKLYTYSMTQKEHERKRPLGNDRKPSGLCLPSYKQSIYPPRTKKPCRALDSFVLLASFR